MRLVVVVAALALAAPAAAQPSRIKLDRVVAVVNDTVILRGELDARLAPALAQLQSIGDPIERQRQSTQLAAATLDEMIDEELVIQAATEAHIAVTGAEVDEALREIKDQNNLDDEALQRTLEPQGYTLATYKRELRRQLLRLRTINELVSPLVDVPADQTDRRREAIEREAKRWIAKLRAHAYVERRQ